MQGQVATCPYCVKWTDNALYTCVDTYAFRQGSFKSRQKAKGKGQMAKGEGLSLVSAP